MTEPRKVKVYMGIPSNGIVCDSQSYMLREIEAAYKDKVELVYPDKLVRRIFHDFARNAIVEEFLATDCDVLWFLDSDISPQRHVLDLITEHGDKWEVAGAPYPVFMCPPGEKSPSIVFCVYKGKEGRGLIPADVPHEGIEFVDGLATGCMFIKRGVFTKLERPYFEFKYDPLTRLLTEGEDLGFCKKVNELGFQFFTDYSMVCKHYKNVCLLEMNNYTVSYANKSVTRYDALIRGQVEALKESLAGKKVSPPLQSKPQIILPSGY